MTNYVKHPCLVQSKPSLTPLSSNGDVIQQPGGPVILNPKTVPHSTSKEDFEHFQLIFPFYAGKHKHTTPLINCLQAKQLPEERAPVVNSKSFWSWHHLRFSLPFISPLDIILQGSLWFVVYNFMMMWKPYAFGRNYLWRARRGGTHL